MQGVTHMAGGAAFAAVYTLVAHPGLSIGQEAAIIGIGALGGLIPDIDHPNSKISHKLKPVSAVVSLMFSHRGFSTRPSFTSCCGGFGRCFVQGQSIWCMADCFFWVLHPISFWTV